MDNTKATKSLIDKKDFIDNCCLMPSQPRRSYQGDIIDKRNKPFWSEQKRSANNFECKYLDFECNTHVSMEHTPTHSIAKKV